MQSTDNTHGKRLVVLGCSAVLRKNLISPRIPLRNQPLGEFEVSGFSTRISVAPE